MIGQAIGTVEKAVTNVVKKEEVSGMVKQQKEQRGDLQGLPHSSRTA